MYLLYKAHFRGYNLQFVVLTELTGTLLKQVANIFFADATIHLFTFVNFYSGTKLNNTFRSGPWFHLEHLETLPLYYNCIEVGIKSL